MGIAENYKTIEENMQNACDRSRRKREDVMLIAVTKFIPLEKIIPAFALGIRHVGENRAQEFRDKAPTFKAYGCTCHFIGQLQLNKVKYVAGQADLIQSVDRLELAEEINKHALKLQILQDILIEVNIGGEAQKGGVPQDTLLPFLQGIQQLEGIRVKGLMCVPPIGGMEETRPYFIQMRELFENCKNVHCKNVFMEELSMGMSHDYTAAIEEGATMVRIGTALFGPRPPA